MTNADEKSGTSRVHGLLEDLFEKNASVRDATVAAWAKTLRPGARVLDVGAGACNYAAAFAHCDYVAQDLPDVDLAPSGRIIVRSDINHIPLPSSSIDAILCTEVFEHIEDPIAALGEFARLLKPGGLFLLSVPAASRVHRVPTHFYGGFAPDFFEGTLQRKGFVLEELRPLGNWSLYMAQELGRFPDVLRNSSSLPSLLRSILYPFVWPVFRIAFAGAFIGFSRFDQSDDLPLGWLAFARRSDSEV